MNYCSQLYSVSESIINRTVMTVVESGASVTFKQMQIMVRRMAGHLIEQGVQSGDRVAFHLFNGIECVIVHMAIQYVGAVSVLVDPLLQPGGMDFYVTETEAALLVTHADPAAFNSDLKTRIHRIDDYNTIYSDSSLDSKAGEMHDWDPDQNSSIYFTSGTTSRPKGVMLSLNNQKNAAAVADTYWTPVDESSKHVMFVPYSHGFGSVFLIPLTIRTGSQVFILRSFHPIKVAETIQNEGITHIYGVPSHYQQLLRFSEFHPAYTKLKMAFCAAAKLEFSVMEEWKSVAGFTLSEGYGLIETTTGVTWRVTEEPRGTGHMGPCPDKQYLEIGIMDPSTGKILPSEEEGEIVIRGKSVMEGYLNFDDVDQSVFKDGWFRSGDRGYLSKDDHLFMTGRIKDIINIAGIKISPYEVEAVLNDHEAVRLSMVVSAEDKLYGEVVKAFVQLEPGIQASERDLIKHAASRLMSFQVPKIVQFLDDFPQNNMGKVDRKALRQM